MTKFHINKHGIPAPCRATKDNCPLGGDESHFSTKEEAQEYINKENESKYGLLSVSQNEEVEGSYIGGYHKISKHADDNFNQSLTRDNFNQVLSEGFKDGDIEFEYEEAYMGNIPLEFKANISKVDDDKYKITGELKGYFYEERDFDDREDYEEYLEDEPEVREVSYEFTGDNLKDKLIRNYHLEKDRKHHESQSTGVILYGVYKMTRDKVLY